MSSHHRNVITFLILVLSAYAVHAENPQNFKVESPTHEQTFELSQQKGKVVVLHFLLKTECPYCLKHTHEYARLANKHPDVVQVFLKPDTPEEIRSWEGNLKRDDLESLPIIYRDPEATLAVAYGIPDGYRFHGKLVHYPALVILDGKGQERFRYVGKSNKDRMKPEEFLAKLKELNLDGAQ